MAESTEQDGQQTAASDVGALPDPAAAQAPSDDAAPPATPDLAEDDAAGGGAQVREELAVQAAAAMNGEPADAAAGQLPPSTDDVVDGTQELEVAGEPEPAAEADASTLDGAVPSEPAGEQDIEAVAEDDLRRPAAELKAIVEAMIFASPEPLTPKALAKLLDNEPREDVLEALEALKVEYERPSGLQLVEVAGGFQIVTRPDLHEWVRRLFHERSSQKLSVQALETLAVIAYRQPITALEITEIRGVSASGVLNTLLERHLIKIVGRKQVVGRPFMYATTKEFLIRFGLKDLNDLPRVEDMAESLGIESSLLVEQTPPEEQLPLSEPDYSVAGSSDPDTADGEPDDDEESPAR